MRPSPWSDRAAIGQGERMGAPAAERHGRARGVALRRGSGWLNHKTLCRGTGVLGDGVDGALVRR